MLYVQNENLQNVVFVRIRILERSAGLHFPIMNSEKLPEFARTFTEAM